LGQEETKLNCLLSVFRDNFGGVRSSAICTVPSGAEDLFSAALKRMDAAEKLNAKGNRSSANTETGETDAS
jgi:hypothetical protein